MGKGKTRFTLWMGLAWRSNEGNLSLLSEHRAAVNPQSSVSAGKKKKLGKVTVYHMAFANLGRNKGKTAATIVSLMWMIWIPTGRCF